ncbi:hypothetical protein ACC756_27980 [Rhizobium ruizarguesonis]
MTTKLKELEIETKDRLSHIKQMKAKVVTQIKELDFHDLEQSQKIRIAMSVGDTF